MSEIAKTFAVGYVELRAAIDRSGMDISPCASCGLPVICLPDGLGSFCVECWKAEGEPKPDMPIDELIRKLLHRCWEKLPSSEYELLAEIALLLVSSPKPAEQEAIEQAKEGG